MKVLFAVAAVAVNMAISTSLSQADAGSAELTDVSGKVLVNVGKGFHVAKPQAILAMGNEVFVAEGASATLLFPGSKCEVVLAPASITRISNSDMCQHAGRNSALFRSADGEVVITPVNGTILPASGAAPGIISPYYIAGGIFAINAAAFTNAVLTKDSPVSAP
jgi:hypothetical protein